MARWLALSPSPGTPIARSSRPSASKSAAASEPPKASHFSAAPFTPWLDCVYWTFLRVRGFTTVTEP
ncbi:hypothetical protein GCM10020219_069840 [Nonomuraea dietziae]